MIKKIFFTFFLVFNLFFANVVSPQNGPNCPSGICIGPGGVITTGSLTVTSNSFYSSITIKNGATLTVRSGVTLYVGQVGTAANTQVVDFQNGCFVVVESGASLVVNGLLNNSNNSNGVTINGSVSVIGNVTAGNGSTIVGTGTIDTSGTITTDGSGSIFGSTGDCLTGPCSGSQLNCSGETNIISGNQTICSGNTPITLIGSTTINPATYQWQNSATTGANFIDIPGATLPNYSPGSLTTTTYYRRKKTVGGCTGTSSQVTILVNALPTASLTSNDADNIFCTGTSVTFTATGGTNYNFRVAGTSVQNGASVTYTTTALTSSQVVDVIVTNASGCTATSSGIINIVNALPTASLTSNDTDNTFCAGTSVTFTATGGTNYNFRVAGTSVQNSATANYTTTALTTGQVVDVIVTNASGCSATSSGINNTVNALPSALSVSTTQPTCAVPTATITITAVAGETYSFDGSLYSGTLVYSGLAQGSSHTISAMNMAGCISAVTNVAINTTDKTWNGAWSPSAPTSADNIVFTGTGVYNSTGDLTACSCLVNGSVTVNINSGNTLTLTNELTVTSFGSITFHNNASLVQINNVVNSGDIDYVRTTNTVVRNTDYTYWSSPVSPQTIGNFSPYTPDGMMYSYNSNIEDWKQEYLSTSMDVGIGYIVRGPEPSGPPPPPSQFTAIFTGVPNNGDVTVPVPYNTNFSLDPTDPNYGVSYLLGNPYPSALNADTFLNDNAGVLKGTLYFWTHNTQIGTGVSDPGTGVYRYSGDDYASYNITGGVGIAPDITAAATSLGNNTSIPNGYITAGQGFFATSKAAGTVNFTNTMRVAGNNSQFFKKRNSKTEKVIEKNRIWLNLTNTQGAFKQTLVGYITDATNDYDDRFDGESFDGNEFVDFYSLNQDKNLVIQGRGLPFDENDEVPLGYRTTINGAFTINIDQADGLLANQAVFIEDKLTNTITDLKSGNYTFNTVAGTFNDRFVLRYKINNTAKTLATSKYDTLKNKVLVSSKNKQIKINSFTETIEMVTIYDLQGRQIYHKDKVNNSELSIANLVSSRQVLVVKTVLQNGVTVTDKIIY